MNDPHETLDQAERDHLATYVSQPSARSWPYQLGIAVAGGTAVASGDIESPWIAIPLAVGAAAIIGILYGALMRRTGVNPRLRSMPSSLRWVLIGYWVAAALVIGPTLLWAFTTEAAWAYTRAGIVVALVAGGGGLVADRLYQQFARRLAASAGIEGE